MTEGKRSKRSKKGGENGDGNTTADGDISTISVGDQETRNKVVEEEDDTTWSADVSEEAVRARMQDLTDGAKTMTYASK